MDPSLCRSFIHSVQQSIKNVCFPREGTWACLKQKAEDTIVYTFPLFTAVLSALGNPLQLDPLPLPLISCTQECTFLLFHFLTSQNCTNNFQTSKPLVGTQGPLSTKELKVSIIISLFSTSSSFLYIKVCTLYLKTQRDNPCIQELFRVCLFVF